MSSQTALSTSKLILNLLQYTYIHTYIPPLKGVCMYVCMYYVLTKLVRSETQQQTRVREEIGCKFQLKEINSAIPNRP